MKTDTTLISMIEYEDLLQKSVRCKVLEHQLDLIYEYAKHMNNCGAGRI